MVTEVELVKYLTEMLNDWHIRAQSYPHERCP